jgi:hypothetical protein
VVGRVLPKSGTPLRDGYTRITTLPGEVSHRAGEKLANELLLEGVGANRWNPLPLNRAGDATAADPFARRHPGVIELIGAEALLFLLYCYEYI